MRVDNRGEGAASPGSRSCSGSRRGRERALDRHGRARRDALFYGDAVITPAISILSAVEGLTLLDAGYRIRWTANDKNRGLHNSALARVLTIDANGVTVETADKERLTFDLRDPMLSRLDLAYSFNIHTAQAITTDKAVTVVSSQERTLSYQRLFNVGVTRVRDELTMVVDDKEKLERQFDNNAGNKTSALETIGRLDVDRERLQVPGTGPSEKFDPGPIDLKNLPPLAGEPAPPAGDGKAPLLKVDDLKSPPETR